MEEFLNRRQSARRRNEIKNRNPFFVHAFSICILYLCEFALSISPKVCIKILRKNCLWNRRGTQSVSQQLPRLIRKLWRGSPHCGVITNLAMVCGETGDVERPALSLLNTFRWCLHYADSGNTAARTLGTQTRGQAAVKCFVTKCSALKIATFWMTAKWIRVWCKRLSAQKAAPCEKFKEAGIKF